MKYMQLKCSSSVKHFPTRIFMNIILFFINFIKEWFLSSLHNAQLASRLANVNICRHLPVPSCQCYNSVLLDFFQPHVFAPRCHFVKNCLKQVLIYFLPAIWWECFFFLFDVMTKWDPLMMYWNNCLPTWGGLGTLPPLQPPTITSPLVKAGCVPLPGITEGTTLPTKNIQVQAQVSS